MNQTVRAQSEPQLPVVDPMISMIERAARDPNIDIEKLERLLVLQEKAQLRAAETAFNAAMSKAQSEMGPIAADSNNPQTKSRYASYFALDKALRPIYSSNGFALSFDTGEAHSESWIKVLCHVSHREGYTRIYHVDMPADGKGAKGGDVMTKTHAVGSGMTYGQRYPLKMIFNISIGSDDDGNAASPRQQIKVPSAPVEAEKVLVEDIPCLLTPFRNEKFPQWSERFIASVNTANTKEEVAAWETLNSAPLTALPDDVWKPVEAALLAKVATFDKPAPKSDPISSGPQTFTEEEILAAIKAAKTSAELDQVWVTYKLDDMDPFKREAIDEAYNLREIELDGAGS